MHDLVLRSIAVALAAAVLTTPVAIAEEPPGKARCDQLIEYSTIAVRAVAKA
jgi:hypothetical protein